MNEIRDVKPLTGLWRKTTLRDVAARNDKDSSRQAQSDKNTNNDESDPSEKREVKIDEYA